jgi:hypothetical protein
LACSAPDAAPGFVPNWIYCPREKILEVVVAWIVNGIEAVRDETVFAVQTVQNQVIQAFEVAGSSTFDVAQGAGRVVLDAQRSVNDALLALGAEAGIAGPVAVAVTFSLSVAFVFGAFSTGAWVLKWVT